MPALITHTSPDAVFAWSRGRAITARDYLAAVEHMASRMPAGVPVLNLCGLRHHFAVVLGAALVQRAPLLLPSTRTPDMLKQLQAEHPGLYVVQDDDAENGGLPRIHYERGPVPDASTAFAVPEIEADHVAAYVFTSGSTGRPTPHAKRWGSLVRSAQGEGQRVRQQAGVGADVNFTVTGTVPAQHMFGFESTILIALQNGWAIDPSLPFYPADIAASLQASPAPRLLVSSPFHLRTLVDAGVALPKTDLILCATAPLTPQLARTVEEHLQGPLLEIYGCTETGQLATRRTADGESWTVFDGVHLRAANGEGPDARYLALGGHVEIETELSDVLQLHSPQRFDLLGRHADMVNIAGKRTSLAYLTHQLISVPGVQDGALYLPSNNDSDASNRVQRPVAFVVAPTLTEAQVLQVLRDRIDSAFMPRPVYFLDALPRNATGKLPQATLAELAQQIAARAKSGKSS